MQLVNRLPDGVTFKSEDVVGVLLRVGECLLPEAVRICGLLPCAVIAFVDRVTQRNASAFDGPDVVAEIHEQSGVLGQALQPRGEFAFELIACAHVDFGFLEADRAGAPDGGIAANKKHKSSSYGSQSKGQYQTSFGQQCRYRQ